MKQSITISLLLTTLAGSVYAQAPIFVSNFYNPCGNDGNNEFLVGQASTSAFNPTNLYYFVSGANPDGSGRDSLYQDAFCGSLTATGSGSNACNGAGWTKSPAVGSGSFRILNYTDAADQLKIDSVIARLNYRLETCPDACTNTFVAPDLATGLIPAGAKFIFFISQGINDTAVTGPSSAINFCGFCNEGPFYVIVGSFPPGTSGLLTNTYTATTTRYVSLAYDFGAGDGPVEIHSYLHSPSSGTQSARNNYHTLPQGPDILNNTLAATGSTIGCNITPDVVLPVNLTRFSGIFQEGTVQLTWQTATEKEADRFEIERSTDATSFSTIGSVRASGNTSQLIDYDFIDAEPFSGKGFYRLKQIDLDGRFRYSGTIMVQTTGLDNAVTLYPNPATDHIRIRVKALADATISGVITNTSGITVGTFTRQVYQGSNELNYSIKDYAAGMYYLRLHMDQEVIRQIIVKQ